jgi:hypothetical protein
MLIRHSGSIIEGLQAARLPLQVCGGSRVGCMRDGITSQFRRRHTAPGL